MADAGVVHVFQKHAEKHVFAPEKGKSGLMLRMFPFAVSVP
jgi:hypothetical protein